MDSEHNEAVAARLLEFVDRMEDVVGVCDEHGRVLYLNQAARKQLGFGAESELTTADFFAPEAFASYYDEVRPALLRSGTWTGELPILTQGGDSVAMLFSVVAGVAPGGEITGLVTHGRPLPGAAPVSTRDAGDNAAHIIDRDIVLSRLSEELERRSEDFVAVVYAEVRDIRTLTQRHGGFVADGVMRTVGRRLTSTVRASDFVGRVGRNAFFVLCTDTRDAAEAMRLVQSLEDAFERELIWSVAGELSISLRCGLAIAERGDDPEAVLRRAQLASTSTAAPVGLVEASEDPTLVAACEALRPAVMTGDVQTLVATVVDRTGRVAGYHAFPRWASAEFGVWESHRLDVIAQRAGVSTALTLQVLREAAAFVMTSPADATTSISVALAESLIQDAYVEQYLWEVVDAVGIAPGQIALLVDEAAMATSSSPAALRSLRETGAKIVATSLDQGSDVIGLVADHHCVDLWLSERIVDELETDGSARTAVSSLIALAHDIGARVTAPGVRTQPQHEVLLAAQVDFMTGAFFGAPTSAE